MRILNLLLAWVVFGVSCTSTPSNTPPNPSSGLRQAIQTGRAAPDFALKTFDGQTVTLSGLRGQRVLLNFWAAWCAPCKKEMPDFNAAFAELKGQNVAFVGIGTQDRTENLKAFADEIKVSYTLVEDPDGTVGDAYGVLGLPMSVFVDSAGVIQKVQVGPMTKDEVLQTFAEMK